MSTSFDPTKKLFESIYANNDNEASHMIRNADSLNIDINAKYNGKNLLDTIILSRKYELLRELAKKDKLNIKTLERSERVVIEMDDLTAFKIGYDMGIFLGKETNMIFEYDSYKILDYMLTENLIDVHEKKNGYYLIKAIRENKSPEFIEVLLKHGSNPNAFSQEDEFDDDDELYEGSDYESDDEPDEGEHVLTIAGDNLDYIKLLIKYGADPMMEQTYDTPVLAFMLNQHDDIDEFLIDKGYDVMLKNDMDMTLIDFDSETPSLPVLDKLLRVYGNQIEDLFSTPLSLLFEMFRVRSTREKVDRSLIGVNNRAMLYFLHGVDMMSKDKEGRTILDIAEDFEYGKDQESKFTDYAREKLIEIAKRYMNPNLEMLSQRTIFQAGGNFSIFPRNLQPIKNQNFDLMPL